MLTTAGRAVWELQTRFRLFKKGNATHLCGAAPVLGVTTSAEVYVERYLAEEKRVAGSVNLGQTARGAPAAFDYFNQRLFAGALPEMFVRFAANGRMTGFYCPAAWYGEEEEDIDELTLNPSVLTLAPCESLSILVHKMCHFWQFGHGRPSVTTRHNREWAAKMSSIGLRPMTSSKPCIQLDGQRVGHAIVRGGKFDRAFKAMPS